MLSNGLTCLIKNNNEVIEVNNKINEEKTQ